MLYGIAVLLSFLVAGEAVSAALHLPMPGPVSGMLLLLLWSMARRRVDERVAKTATSLLSYLGLFFLPAGAGLLVLGDVLQQHGLALAVVVALSTLITLLVTALVLHWLLRRRYRSGA
ncbi:CidA/LrgA family protein [Amantichitinum ursilacus]|uniref:Holin-like protein n=1 Tax=Amantichitinum ursilacus TaxID=857265 RepID=A0A0N0GP44_9NEIS|nr:CidA/LrgA family protein [Amantichitinum ursilacus]KPC53413.1 holin-like protein [Amantichitinum ursilacus]